MAQDLESADSHEHIEAPEEFPNSRQIFRICLNLKLLIDKVIPIVYDEKDIKEQNSAVLNRKVIRLVYDAAGGKGEGKPGSSSYKYRAALPFCLLTVCGWYWQQSEFELWDNELYLLRALASQRLCAIIIDEQTSDKYLFLEMLCKKYVIHLHSEDARPASALELAVDMHSTIVMSSSGYQRCIKWIWRGWIIQSSSDNLYKLFDGVSSTSILSHFDPQRIKTPLYQNILEIFFSLFYLALFTIVLNTHQSTTTDLDGIEILFYLFTAGYVLDELIKVYHVGFNYIGFWNAFNDSMYTIVVFAIVFRFLSLNTSGKTRTGYDEVSFRVLSCASPFMWSRLLLFLDAQKFVGAMIVVLKTMMKESIIFFVLLAVVILGFLEGFLGLDASDGKSEATRHILISLTKTVIGGSSFDDVATLVPPYASILYYIYCFVLSVILMNILIALYSTAYASIVENATDEYFALVAQKTLRYTRAPDSDLYVPPLNLIEVVITPLIFVTSRKTYRLINYFTMLVIYSPLLAYITVDEISLARKVQYNRFKGLPDDANEVDTEWDLTDGYEVDATSTWEGIQERNSEVYEALRFQREGELADPEFRIDIYKFRKDIELCVQPVEEASNHGIKWDLYHLYEKLDKLQSVVEEVVAENKALKSKASHEPSSD